MKNKLFLLGMLLFSTCLLFAQDDTSEKEKALIDSVAAINAASAENAAAMEAYNEGISLYQSKNYSGAIASYNKAIGMHPEFVDAHYNKGIAQLENGKHDGGIATFNKVIELEPTNSKAYRSEERV